MLGESLAPVSKQPGHWRHCITAGYARLSDVHVVEAAERVDRILLVVT